MTVANPYSPSIYTGNGVQTIFNFNFQIISDTNSVPDITTVEVQLNAVTQGSGFTTLANQDQESSPGGTVTFNTAPALGVEVAFYRVTPVTQLLDFPLAAKFSTAALEVAFDKTCMNVQENEFALAAAPLWQNSPAPGSIPETNPSNTGFNWIEPVQAGNVVLDGGPGVPFSSGPVTSAAGGNVVAPIGGATIGHLASFAATNGQTLADSGISAASITAQIAAAIAALPTPFNNLRVYLVSGSPYADGSSSGNSNIYAGPLPTGNKQTVDNGSGVLSIVTITEISLALTLTSGSAYSVFLVNTAGAQTLEVDVWSNSTTPLTYARDGAGRFCKSGSTNKLLIAELYAAATNKVYDWTGSRHLVNLYNQQEAVLFAQDTSASWAGTGAIEAHSTVDGTGRVSIFVGSNAIPLKVDAMQNFSTGAANVAIFGLGLNSTSAFTVSNQISGAATQEGVSVHYAANLTTGLNFIQRLDNAPNTTTVTGTLNNLAGMITN
jgi:hypothetical protein